jgi:hypothetical protein
MKYLIAIVFFILLTYALSSCYTQGYGCHGNSRIMTRVR